MGCCSKCLTRDIQVSLSFIFKLEVGDLMHDELKKFIEGAGALVEIWTIIYSQFLNQGYDSTTAMLHTKELLQVVIHEFK